MYDFGYASDEKKRADGEKNEGRLDATEGENDRQGRRRLNESGGKCTKKNGTSPLLACLKERIRRESRALGSGS